LSTSLRTAGVSVGFAVVATLAIAAVLMASNRPALVVSAASSSTPATGIMTSGDATISKKPDLATVSAGIQSQAGTAASAQSALAANTAKLIARIKALGVPDQDLSTTGYWVGPVYTGDQVITAYRASEELVFKWHNVDSVGNALDAIVQEGGATNISVGFGLNDPKSAEAEARSLAIADARSKAQAMASAAGVRVGQVVRISDLSTSSRPPYPYAASAAAGSIATQVPVGQMDVGVTVEVDFALG